MSAERVTSVLSFLRSVGCTAGLEEMLTPAGQVMVVGVMRVPASMEIGGEIAKPMIYDSSSERPTISEFRRVVTFPM